MIEGQHRPGWEHGLENPFQEPLAVFVFEVNQMK